MNLETFKTELQEKEILTLSNESDQLNVWFSNKIQRFVIELNGKYIDTSSSLKTIWTKVCKQVENRHLILEIENY